MSAGNAGVIPSASEESPAPVRFAFLRWGFLAALGMTLVSLHASELTVDKKTLSLDDTLTITVTLDNRYDTEDLQIPAQNLEIRGPSQSVEYSFDGAVSRFQRVLRYLGKPKYVGAASVGPVTLRRRDGEIETLPMIALQVIKATPALSNDPLTTLRELLATQRDPVFLVAEADKSEVYAGEEIVVTWMLYNATNVQRFGVEQVPHLDDFWSEEIPLRETEPERLMLGEYRVQRIPIRRAALFPLRSGTLTIGSMAVGAAVLRRVGTDRFGIPFEGMIADITRRSPEIVIQARPIPPGPAVSAVGDVTMNCNVAPQQSGGPVVVHAIVSGWANLRAAAPPVFERALDGEVQIADAGFVVDRGSAAARMTRRWRFMIFPARSGVITIPPIAFPIFAGGERKTLRCAERTLNVVASEAPADAPHGAMPLRVERVFNQWPLIAAIVGALIVFIVAVPRVRRARARRALVRALVRETPAETRDAVHDYLVAQGVAPAALLVENSDLGDAFRALHSLAAGAERMDVGRGEIERRVRDLVRVL